MAKDTFYFSHDYNSRADEKIKLLIRRHGLLGYGTFWAIIEDLYNNANALRTDYDGIAFDLHTSPNIVQSIINDFDLYSIEQDHFGSISVQRRILARTDKSLKARESALNRWNKNEQNANALPTQSDCNAIKENKVKESKEINIDFSVFWDLYPNKIGRKRCEEKWNKLKDEERIKSIHTLPSFINYKPFKTYNHPNPETYINQKRWEDIIPIDNTVKKLNYPDLPAEHALNVHNFNCR